MPIVSIFPTGSGGSGGSGIPLAPVTGLATLAASGKAYLKWTDPIDTVVGDATLAAWAGTLLVRKAGSMPTNRRDGTVVIDNKTRDAYKTQYFCDSGLTDGVEYFYKFFPYTTSNAYTDSAADAFSATPNPVAVGDVSGITLAAAGNGKLSVMWTDPDATIVNDGVTLATWASTVVVVKEGRYAVSPTDPDAAFTYTSTTRNGHAAAPLVATGLKNGTTYYVSLFPMSTDGSANTNTANRKTGVANKITISTTPSQSGSLTYNTNPQSPSWSNYNSAQLTLGGVTSGTNVGSYNAIFTPKDDYMWSDGTTAAKTVSWSIGKATVTVPTDSSSFTYDGNQKSPVWSGYDSAKMTLGGTSSATNAGTYTATFTPTANYKWSDGTTAAKNVTWSIAKAAGSLSLSTTSVTLNTATLTSNITVTRAGDGAITATSSNSSVATVTVSGTTVTVTAVGSGSSTITVKVAEGTNHTAPANKTVSVTAALANVFGVCWDMSNSSTALTRLTPSNDPNGLVTVNITTNPSPAVGTGAGSSPFDNYSPWKDMDEYNIVNNAVSHKRGSSSFSRTNYNTMVYVPTFYYRIFDSNGKRYFYISDTAISGFTKHPGSNKYVGRYNTIAGTNTSLSRVAVPGGDIPASASGHSPRVSLTRAAFREAARSKGDKWSLYDYVTWCAVWLLYLIEFADWNSQAKIGQGIVSASAAQNTGGTDTMSYHTGRAAGTDGQTAVQYRHIENPWGNVYEWIDGINFDDRTVRVCTDPAKYADDTTTDYMVASTITGSNGFIKSLGSSTNAPYAFLPNAVGGSNSTYIPDYYYQNTGWRVLRVGGSWNNGLIAGLFFFRADSTSSSSHSLIGARLLYHP